MNDRRPVTLTHQRPGRWLNSQELLAMAKINGFSIQLGSLCLWTWLALANCGWAHPFHTTTAEMEFNSATGRFEVALKIPLSDFEHMIRLGVDLEKVKNDLTRQTSIEPARVGSEQWAKHAAPYIDKQFTVTVAGKACRLEWVGTEDDRTSKWIYFELILPQGQAFGGELMLTNKVLSDLNSNQINTVVFISRAGRVSLKTHDRNTTVCLPQVHE